MIRCLASLLALIVTPCFASAQPSTSALVQGVTLPPGTPFPVEIDRNLPMRVGAPLRAHLLYAIYSGSTLVLPADTSVLGTIIALQPDHSRRVRARFNADFTPFYTPVVRFTQVQLADGTTLPLTSGDATDGAPIFRIVAPPPQTRGFLHSQFETVITAAKDRIDVFTAPDKGDRMKQFLYSQLPYHPQRIAKGTAWTVESTAPLTIAQLPIQPAVAAQPSAATDAPPTWMVQAYLKDALSSQSTQSGQSIKATVAEPIYNPDGTIAVPQGATLVGAVTKAKPARRFGRAGALSFSFRQLILPEGEPQSIQTSLKGADAASAAELAMTSEGEVKPKPQDKLAVPLLLLALAARPLDRDGGEHMLGKNAVASNSLGLIAFIIGTAAQQPNIAAGFGYYGAARAIYDRWIARGKVVTFAKDTRIVLQTTARRSPAIKPTAAN